MQGNSNETFLFLFENNSDSRYSVCLREEEEEEADEWKENRGRERQTVDPSEGGFVYCPADCLLFISSTMGLHHRIPSLSLSLSLSLSHTLIYHSNH